ncbi:MAG: hypothetical protein J6T16_05565 [Opitutales bacterium]|nr:hypothetical protein [Opitutales bacterium]
MGNQYFLQISYACKAAGGKIRHYRGILACNADKKYYFNVKRTPEFEMAPELKLATLQKYEAEVFSCPFHVRDAYNAVKRALKSLSGGIAVRDVDIMRVEATRTYPDDFKSELTYERAEKVIGKEI